MPTIERVDDLGEGSHLGPDSLYHTTNEISDPKPNTAPSADSTVIDTSSEDGIDVDKHVELFRDLERRISHAASEHSLKPTRTMSRRSTRKSGAIDEEKGDAAEEQPFDFKD